jgi:hypothetical protein
MKFNVASWLIKFESTKVTDKVIISEICTLVLESYY